MKKPFPWYSETRSGGGWFVKLNGEQNFLGKHPDDAPKPKKGRDGRWKPPQAILDSFYKLMAMRDTASKSDYTFGTVCALFQDELGETNPELAKRYEQTLLPLCEFVYKGKEIGKLLVNAELEGIHLQKWAERFPSTQTQRTYINCCKAVLKWAVNKKGINISHNPFLSVKSPKIESRAVVISREEHEALLKLWKDDCYCDFLQAMWYTALLTKVGDDLEIASNTPEWVTLREVYDHFRWRMMTSWEQRKLLKPAQSSDLVSSINRLEELNERIERRLATAGVGERQSRSGDQAMTSNDVAEFLGCSYCEARVRLLDGRIRAVRDGRWLRTRREWVEESELQPCKNKMFNSPNTKLSPRLATWH